jgi:hypothetical protein
VIYVEANTGAVKVSFWVDNQVKCLTTASRE